MHNSPLHFSSAPDLSALLYQNHRHKCAFSSLHFLLQTTHTHTNSLKPMTIQVSDYHLTYLQQHAIGRDHPSSQHRSSPQTNTRCIPPSLPRLDIVAMKALNDLQQRTVSQTNANGMGALSLTGSQLWQWYSVASQSIIIKTAQLS